MHLSVSGLISQRIRVLCGQIEPVYQPLMSPACVDGRHILVLWAPGSDNRPHRAAESLSRGAPRHYYIRLGSDTCRAEGAQLTALMQMTAKIPFDDRRAAGFQLSDLRAGLVREFLRDVGSTLHDESDEQVLFQRMRLTVPANGHALPRNIGLLFFSDDPEMAFPGARIEVVQFADDAGGDVIEERVFRGPLSTQLRAALGYLRTLTTAHFQKQPDRAETRGWVSYPISALEEVLVNAVYHRSYEGISEPTKVYLYPGRVEVTSYPGPMPGLTPEHFAPDAVVPPVPARNRRVGELFNALRLAEPRGTGIPKVYRAKRQNGSPTPRFDFGSARSYFARPCRCTPGDGD